MFIKIVQLFFMIIAACTTQGCVSDSDPQGTTIMPGDSLPEFSIVLNNGELISKSTLKGKVPVIVFFNTGCSDCRKELPIVQQLWLNYKDDSEVVIMAISREESAKEISEYWEEHNLTIPWSAQENRDIYSLFAPSVIPRIFIADRNGIVTFSSGDSDMPTLQTLIDAVETAK